MKACLASKQDYNLHLFFIPYLNKVEPHLFLTLLAGTSRHHVLNHFRHPEIMPWNENPKLAIRHPVFYCQTRDACLLLEVYSLKAFLNMRNSCLPLFLSNMSLQTFLGLIFACSAKYLCVEVSCAFKQGNPLFILVQCFVIQKYLL